MESYTIRVHVGIVPSTELPTTTPMKQADGSFQMTLAEDAAINIDACEQAVLRTAYPTLRNTLATHFSEVAKKKPVSI